MFELFELFAGNLPCANTSQALLEVFSHRVNRWRHHQAGPSATLKDVARGILDRLVERPELEVQVVPWWISRDGSIALLAFN